MSRPLHIKGAQVWDGPRTTERDLYVKNGRIVSEKPNHAVEVDLEGYTLFPGLINAHDHLELNHFPRTKFRDVYDNAHQWGEDVNARLNDEPFKTLRSYPLWDRVFIGGLKNLLCGATTVIHHGPPHKPMYRKDFPVRVLKNYGWAHSLHFNTEEEIIRSYQNTPKNHPWFIHLAEGTDEVAASEYQRLKKLGCLGENTVIVHGVGIIEREARDYKNSKRGIVWCPSTNIYLLDKTIHYSSITMIGGFMLGSDSRLTASGDLLDELRLARKLLPQDRIPNAVIFGSVAWKARRRLRFSSRHEHAWIEGREADFIALKIDYETILPVSMLNATRVDLAIVAKDGIPQIGDPDMMSKFPHVETVVCTLDGVEKRMNVELARQVHRCKLKEQGLEVDELPKGKRFIFF